VLAHRRQTYISSVPLQEAAIRLGLRPSAEQPPLALGTPSCRRMDAVVYVRRRLTIRAKYQAPDATEGA